MAGNVAKLASAVAALTVLTACGSGSKSGGSPDLSGTPAAGRATLAVAPAEGEGYVPPSALGPAWADGLIVTPEGKILVNSHDQLQELDLASHTLRDFPAASDPGARSDKGVVIMAAEAGGALVEGHCTGLYRQPQAGRPWTLLAGRDCDKDKTAPRGDSDPVPATEQASSAVFSKDFAALGYRPDGTLIILDGSVIWALKDGTLTRVYQAPSGSRVMQSASLFVGAVAAGGAIVVGRPTARKAAEPGVVRDVFLLRDVLTVAQDGTTAALDLPPTITGVTGAPGDLGVLSIAAGADGSVYYRVGDLGNNTGELGHDTPNDVLHQYVLRDNGGHWSVVAAEQGTYKDLSAAKWPGGKDVDALAIPVLLPSAIAVLPGRLVLSDGFDPGYALAVGLPG